MAFDVALGDHRGTSEMRFHARENGVPVGAVDHGLKIRGEVNLVGAAGNLEIRHVQGPLGIDVTQRAAEFPLGR